MIGEQVGSLETRTSRNHLGEECRRRDDSHEDRDLPRNASQSQVAQEQSSRSVRIGTCHAWVSTTPTSCMLGSSKGHQCPRTRTGTPLSTEEVDGPWSMCSEGESVHCGSVDDVHDALRRARPSWRTLPSSSCACTQTRR